MNKFKPGDVVRLKSGGAAMTVVAVNSGGLHLIWAFQDELKTSTVPAICLKPAGPDRTRTSKTL
jgi:uncharacterized protein YodC (DUF2158 family)